MKFYVQNVDGTYGWGAFSYHHSLAQLEESAEYSIIRKGKAFYIHVIDDDSFWHRELVQECLFVATASGMKMARWLSPRKDDQVRRRDDARIRAYIKAGITPDELRKIPNHASDAERLELFMMAIAA